jgi:large conductance mechanosensitive channel
MSEILSGFKKFILRGNAVDLAVGVVIGAAFGALVNSLVSDILTPIIGAIAKTTDFSKLVLTVNGSDIKYGSFFNALISFVLVATAVYFFVVTPMVKLWPKHKGEERKSTETKEEVKLLREIRDSVKKN